MSEVIHRCCASIFGGYQTVPSLISNQVCQVDPLIKHHETFMSFSKLIVKRRFLVSNRENSEI